MTNIDTSPSIASALSVYTLVFFSSFQTFISFLFPRSPNPTHLGFKSERSLTISGTWSHCAKNKNTRQAIELTPESSCGKGGPTLRTATQAMS